jgi:predicted dehydrogenase
LLRYGIVGGGFVSRFHLRALESVRGVEVAGLTSRTPPHELAASVRRRGLGEAEVFSSVTEMLPHVDVVAVFAPNDARVALMEEVATAQHLRGVIVEKPLGRNLAEARRVVELAHGLHVPTAYFENQLHMKAVTGALTQLDQVARMDGPPVPPRSTPAPTARGSGTRLYRVEGSSPIWGATASPWAAPC